VVQVRKWSSFASKVLFIFIPDLNIKERSLIMDDQIVTLAKEIQGNIGFLENVVTKTNLIIGTIGIVGVLTIIVLLFK